MRGVWWIRRTLDAEERLLYIVNTAGYRKCFCRGPLIRCPWSSRSIQGWLSSTRMGVWWRSRHHPAGRWVSEGGISSRRSSNTGGQEDRLARAMTHTVRPANELPATPPECVHAPTPATAKELISPAHLDQNRRGCSPLVAQSVGPLGPSKMVRRIGCSGALMRTPDLVSASVHLNDKRLKVAIAGLHEGAGEYIMPRSAS